MAGEVRASNDPALAKLLALWRLKISLRDINRDLNQPDNEVTYDHNPAAVFTNPDADNRPRPID